MTLLLLNILSSEKILKIFNKNDNIKLINITVTLITLYLYCYEVIINAHLSGH